MKDFWSKHHYKIITTSTIIILLGFSYQVMSYLFSLKDDKRKPTPRSAVRSVLAHKVEYGTILSPIRADGRVVSTQQVVLSSEVRGKILEGSVPFKKGQQFRKNQVLIKAEHVGGSLSRTMYLELSTGKIWLKVKKEKIEL